MDKKGRKKLVELAVNGDTDAFSKLYGEIYKELYYYALANLQNAEDAADAAEQQRDPEPDQLHFLQRTAGKQTEAKQQKNE